MDYTAAIDLALRACLSGCLKDPNPNALTLAGATPLEGTKAFWQLRGLEPRREAGLKRERWCMDFTCLDFSDQHGPEQPSRSSGKEEALTGHAEPSWPTSTLVHTVGIGRTWPPGLCEGKGPPLASDMAWIVPRGREGVAVTPPLLGGHLRGPVPSYRWMAVTSVGVLV